MPKDTGKVNIHGKEYSTVALRVQKFREDNQYKYSLQSELVSADETKVVMRAFIRDLEREGYPEVASGYAEEKRNASMINKTSALENCETSAYGRALAAFGMAGTEFASADEVANAIKQQREPATPKQTDDIPSTPEQKQKIKVLLALEGISTEEMPHTLEKQYGIQLGTQISLTKADEIIKDLEKKK